MKKLLLLLFVVSCGTAVEQNPITLTAQSESGEVDHIRIYKNGQALLDSSYLSSPFTFTVEVADEDSIRFTVITNNRFNDITNDASPESLVASVDTLTDFKASYGHILSVRYKF